jgi:site-specific recombinase XerC
LYNNEPLWQECKGGENVAQTALLTQIDNKPLDDWIHQNLISGFVPTWALPALSKPEDPVVRFHEAYFLHQVFALMDGVNTKQSELAERYWDIARTLPNQNLCAGMLDNLRKRISSSLPSHSVSACHGGHHKKSLDEDHPWLIAYANHLRNKGRPERTVQNQCSIARNFLRWLPTLKKFRGSKPCTLNLYQLTRDDVSEYLRHLKQLSMEGERTENTVCSHSTITLSFLRFCIQRYKLHDVVGDLHCLPGPQRTDWWIPSISDIERFFTSIVNYSPRPEMDFSLFGLMYLLGLRPMEATRLRWDGVDFGAREIRFCAKGGAWHTMPMVSPLDQTLATMKARAHGNLQHCFTTWSGARMSSSYMRATFRMYATIAGWPNNSYARTLRHSFCTHLLRESKDYLRVNRLARHRNIDTTERYVHLTGQHYQEAATAVQRELSLFERSDSNACTGTSSI